MRISISLWSINWWLRFTGFRIFVQIHPTGEEEGDVKARIGFMWWGGPFNTGESETG